MRVRQPRRIDCGGTNPIGRRHHDRTEVAGGIDMALIIHRRLAVPAAAAFFAIVLTLPPPATAELMPPVTLFLFLFAIAAVGTAASASAMLRFRGRRSPMHAFISGPANK